VAARACGQSAVLPPQLLEPCRLGGGVPDGVLNVPIAEIILDEPDVRSLVGQRETARMPQYLGMSKKGQGGGLAASVEQQIYGRAVQRFALSTDEEGESKRSCGIHAAGR
jgi:hypothetical protein